MMRSHKLIPKPGVNPINKLGLNILNHAQIRWWWDLYLHLWGIQDSFDLFLRLIFGPVFSLYKNFTFNFLWRQELIKRVHCQTQRHVYDKTVFNENLAKSIDCQTRQKDCVICRSKNIRETHFWLKFHVWS